MFVSYPQPLPVMLPQVTVVHCTLVPWGSQVLNTYGFPSLKLKQVGQWPPTPVQLLKQDSASSGWVTVCWVLSPANVKDQVCSLYGCDADLGLLLSFSSDQKLENVLGCCRLPIAPLLAFPLLHSSVTVIRAGTYDMKTEWMCLELLAVS